MGDLNGYKARYAVERWQTEDQIPPIDQIDQALADIDTALSWTSRNPEYTELKARIIYYRALSLGDVKPELTEIARAKALHLRAIELRRKWPYSWANLVLMKAYLGEFDDEYNHALERAVQYGPWESSVHLTLTHAAMISWPNLSKTQKSIYVENINRGFKFSFNDIKQLLAQYQKTTVICSYLRREGYYKKLCE